MAKIYVVMEAYQNDGEWEDFDSGDHVLKLFFNLDNAVDFIKSCSPESVSPIDDAKAAKMKEWNAIPDHLKESLYENSFEEFFKKQGRYIKNVKTSGQGITFEREVLVHTRFEEITYSYYVDTYDVEDA